jgi:hypothetical protein
MRLQNKVFLSILIIFFLVLAVTQIFINATGKFLLTVKLSEAMKREVTVGSVKVSPFFGLMIKDLEIKDLLKLKEAYVPAGALELLRKNVVLPVLELEGLEMNFTMPPKQAAAAPQGVPPAPPPASSISPGFIAKENLPARSFALKHLLVRQARLNFLDKNFPDKEVKVSVRNLQVNVENLNFADSIIFFKAKGRIPWGQGVEDGTLEIDGWLNPARKDMQASLKIEGIDGVAFCPYYAKWVDLEKARIEKVKLNFNSSIHGLNNDLTAQCRLELTDIVRKARLPEESPEKAEQITDAVLQTFKTLDDGRILLDFVVKTKMDKPKFDVEDIRSAFEDKINKAKNASGFQASNILLLPGKFVEGTVKSATDISKAVINGTFAVGNELKKAVTDSFKKEPKE